VTANVTQIDHISGFCMLNAFMGFDLLEN